MIATETLYRTADDQLVPEGDPKARWLFCAKGTTLDAEQQAFMAKQAAPAAPAPEQPESAAEAPADPEEPAPAPELKAKKPAKAKA